MSPRVRSIIEAVAAEHGVTAADMLGRSRRRKDVAARHDAMRRLRVLSEGERGRGKLDPFSYPSIGKVFNRDHTTVMDACAGRSRCRQTYQTKLERWEAARAAPKLSPGEAFSCGDGQLSHSEDDRSRSASVA